MLKFIEVNNSLLLQRAREKQDSILKNINNQYTQYSHTKNSDLNIEKQMIPLKEYSNKFLRENQPFDRQKENEKLHKNNRFTNLVTKHKFFQKKLVGNHQKQGFICKTEPNQNEYKCFMTSNNFYKEPEKIRTHTQSVVSKTNTLLYQNENEDPRAQSGSDLREIKNKIEQKSRYKGQGAISFKIQQKISASRALQMYAKIITKDKSELLEKIKFTNQKKYVKEKILENKKNLEICHINLQQKQKKPVIAENIEKKNNSKTLFKFRTRNRSVQQKLIFNQDDNFELRGWED